jgi:hypothetical protein
MEHFGDDTLVVSPAAVPVHVFPEHEKESDALTPAALKYSTQVFASSVPGEMNWPSQNSAAWAPVQLASQVPFRSARHLESQSRSHSTLARAAQLPSQLAPQASAQESEGATAHLAVH